MGGNEIFLNIFKKNVLRLHKIIFGKYYIFGTSNVSENIINRVEAAKVGG
jgi:hypothetical protein